MFLLINFILTKISVPDLEIIMALKERHELPINFVNSRCLRDSKSWATTLRIPLDTITDF